MVLANGIVTKPIQKLITRSKLTNQILLFLLLIEPTRDFWTHPHTFDFYCHY